MTHVVMPGSVESMALSNVQSMKAPLGNSRRCVGSTCARTAALTPGRSNAPSSPGSWGPAGGGVRGPEGSLAGAIGAALCGEYTTPDNWRSKVSCSGVLGCGVPYVPVVWLASSGISRKVVGVRTGDDGESGGAQGVESGAGAGGGGGGSMRARLGKGISPSARVFGAGVGWW